MSLTKQEKAILRKCFVELDGVSNSNFKVIVKAIEKLNSDIHSLANTTKILLRSRIMDLNEQLKQIDKEEKGIKIVVKKKQK